MSRKKLRKQGVEKVPARQVPFSEKKELYDLTAAIPDPSEPASSSTTMPEVSGPHAEPLTPSSSIHTSGAKPRKQGVEKVLAKQPPPSRKKELDDRATAMPDMWELDISWSPVRSSAAKPGKKGIDKVSGKQVRQVPPSQKKELVDLKAAFVDVPDPAIASSSVPAKTAKPRKQGVQKVLVEQPPPFLKKELDDLAAAFPDAEAAVKGKHGYLLNPRCQDRGPAAGRICELFAGTCRLSSSLARLEEDCFCRIEVECWEIMRDSSEDLLDKALLRVCMGIA